MDLNLISKFDFLHHQYKNIYSAGPELFFYNPCIGYLKKGHAHFLYKGRTYYASEGDLIYIASGTVYQSIWYGSPDIEWYGINFDFSSKFTFYDYRFQILKNYPSELFDKIYEHHDSSPMASVAYFYLILDDIYKKMEETPKSKFHSTIEPAVSYIENNYNKPITIEKLAKLCNISQSALFEQFKKTFGVTPVSYKHNIMIQHAIDLLSNTKLSIEEISRETGFSSSNYFRKIFTRLTAKTPKELRKK